MRSCSEEIRASAHGGWRISHELVALLPGPGTVIAVLATVDAETVVGVAGWTVSESTVDDVLRHSSALGFCAIVPVSVTEGPRQVAIPGWVSRALALVLARCALFAVAVILVVDALVNIVVWELRIVASDALLAAANAVTELLG